MGGNAFTTLGLATPRMPPTTYRQVLSQTHAILKEHFEEVGTPIETPGKEDHGDIDIVVNGPLRKELDNKFTPATTVTLNLSQVLGAVETIGAYPIINLAIPYPNEADKYIQIDIHISPSKKAFDWEMFHAAHGDLWNIIGSTIRQFGITVNNTGMYLRIPEIEALDKKKAMVFLTDDSNAILEFLGLDAERWWKPFQNQEELFEYAVSCRMFWVKKTKSDDETEGNVIVGGDVEGQEGGESGKKKLKHNDRARIRKRDIFRTWMDEFIPKCRDEGRLGNTKITREEVKDETFAKFGIGDQYRTQLQEWKLLRNKEAVWAQAIKGTIPEDTDPVIRGASTRTFKSVILEGDPFDGTVPKAAQKDADGLYDLDKVRIFVANNWKRAGEIGLEKGQAKMKTKMKVKVEKKALES